MNELSSWSEVLLNASDSFLQKIMSSLPTVLGAIFIFLIGWFLARLLSTVVEKLLGYAKFDDLSNKVNASEFLQKANINTSPTKLIAKFFYWIVMLLVFTSAADALGWDSVTGEISKLISYLPKLFVAIIIFIIGAYFASNIRDIISGATESLGLSTGRIISSFVFYIIIILVGLTSLRQAGIDTSIITSNMMLILGAMLAAASISYGLASKDVLSNILAGYVGRSTYREGMKIEIDGVKGIILESSNVGVKIKQKNGDVVIIPANTFLKNKVKILSKKKEDHSE